MYPRPHSSVKDSPAALPSTTPMSSLPHFFIFATLITTAALAHAASFDCKLAHTPREHTICNSSQLSALDSRLALAYTSLRSQLSPAASATVQSDQRDWLHWLDAVCPLHGRGERANIKDCLTSEYNHRLSALTLGPTLPDGHVVYPRTQYVIASPDKSIAASSPPEVQNPGYGVGTFRWPQIDAPTPQEAAWNHAVYSQALSLTGDDTHHPKSFNAAVDSFGTIDLTYSLRSANTLLIATAFTIFTDGYGAAHPLTAISNFTWWLNRNRQLLATDIFLDTTHWQTDLIPPIVANLNVNPDLKPYLWTGEELRKGITSSLTDPTAWTLSPSGLTLRFSQYAVAPYVAGMPTVTLFWHDLNPYLNPALDPTTLPPLTSSTTKGSTTFPTLTIGRVTSTSTTKSSTTFVLPTTGSTRNGML